MLNTFDWIRRVRTGTELIATLRVLQKMPKGEPPELPRELAAPFSACHRPCQRCYLYPPQSRKAKLCRFCRQIVSQTRKLDRISRSSVIVWAYVDRIPRKVANGEWAGKRLVAAMHPVDENHFIGIMYRRRLKPWLQELVVYEGEALRGVLQILPSSGGIRTFTMGDLLTQVIAEEKLFSLKKLLARFYATEDAILNAREHEQTDIFSFELAQFIHMLDMAEVFRSVLMPREQELLAQALTIADTQEEQFFWGRFLGELNQKARDMLDAWQIRRWPSHQIRLLYELTNYVVFQDVH